MRRRTVLALVTVLLTIVCFGRAPSAPAADNERPLTQDELFDGQKLLEIEIQIAAEDWQALCAQTPSFASAFSKGPLAEAYTHFPADITVAGRHLARVKLRKKGFFGSTDLERPSLKVRFENKQQRQLAAGLDRLTLNNNKQDRALVSQYLGYKLFAAAGLPAPRCSLARVTVNGTLLGVYTHVESIDEPFVRRVFGSDSGNLYEGVFPTDFLMDRLDRFDAKTNKGKKGTKGQSDRADLLQVAELLAQSPADLVDQLSRRIDLDQFLTYWALESLISFWDGYAANQNNYYLYHDPRDSRLHFIPWGADMTLAPPFFPTGGFKSVFAKGQLAYQLNQDPTIRERYHAALLKLLDTVWKEDELLAEIDRIEKLVAGNLHPAQGDIRSATDNTRQFVRNRRAEIMAEIKDGPIHVTTPPAKPFYMREAGKAAGTFQTEWTPQNAKNPADPTPATFELEMNGEKVALQEIVASSGPSAFPAFGGPPGPPPPTIVLSGVRASDGKTLKLTLMFNPVHFQADNKEPVPAQGMLVEGEGAPFGPGMRSFDGKVRLKAASQKQGARVEGSLSGKLYEMRGGFGG